MSTDDDTQDTAPEVTENADDPRGDTPTGDSDHPTPDGWQGDADDDVALDLDADGSLLDPPVIPEFEARVSAAQMAGDVDAIEIVQEDYNEARLALARRRAQRQQVTS